MAAGRPVWRACRREVQRLFAHGSALQQDRDWLARCLVPADQVQMHLPAQIGDYTDFYASKEHATNVGIMFRGKENALMPNW